MEAKDVGQSVNVLQTLSRCLFEARSEPLAVRLSIAEATKSALWNVVSRLERYTDELRETILEKHMADRAAELSEDASKDA